MADPTRVGMYGWSYGGYMSAMCLARAPETFHCAVAGAPVSNWDGYDTHYTERYMGTPQSNPDGYQDSSVTAHAGNIRGRLMLVHGLVDENVHFRHTARLINALIGARKTYDLLLFPDERHLPRKLADRVFMEEQILAFFERELKAK
jgi:dipeptidyl-peptidase-4